PLAAGLVVTHGVIAIAIADVDDLVGVVSRLVMPHGAAGAGRVAVRVPDKARGEAPVAVVAVHVFKRIGRYRRLLGIAVAVVDAGHLYLAVFKVEGLTDAHALPFEPVGFDPAAGDAERNLVGVADTVLAGEAIFTPERGVAEAAFSGVEDRDIILVLFRHIAI